RDNVAQIWRIEPGAPTPRLRTTSLRYKNAKAALLGDSGVGKSGLALVLTGHKFEATESTHGRRVWPFSTERVRAPSGHSEIREVVLCALRGRTERSPDRQNPRVKVVGQFQAPSPDASRLSGTYLREGRFTGGTPAPLDNVPSVTGLSHRCIRAA